ncbi:hypothetical protein [Ruegeria marina]|uniref:Uncharacterized protein n=1 Tax=Ruegeria marina TaxID=639004 RepID=A0A1G6S3C8_9RHOB|nr:hypothetical protein [Ruegeria marina]SDD11422.1 hypothetical protein SAMN04488239_105164 [Ruegeria marina]
MRKLGTAVLLALALAPGVNAQQLSSFDDVTEFTCGLQSELFVPPNAEQFDCICKVLFEKRWDVVRDQNQVLDSNGNIKTGPNALWISHASSGRMQALLMVQKLLDCP